MSDYDKLLGMLSKTDNEVEGSENKNVIFDWSTSTRYEFDKIGNLVRCYSI